MAHLTDLSRNTIQLGSARTNRFHRAATRFPICTGRSSDSVPSGHSNLWSRSCSRSRSSLRLSSILLRNSTK